MAVDARTVEKCCAFLAACAGALLSAVTTAHPQTDGTSVDQAVLQAVALLVHARYGDEPYEFIYTSSGTAIVQETGRSSLRFVVRRVAGSSCVRLPRMIHSGLI
jgi:signal transduction histidine kinase